jgi:hypothetical protein
MTSGSKFVMSRSIYRFSEIFGKSETKFPEKPLKIAELCSNSLYLQQFVKMSYFMVIFKQVAISSR